MLIYGSVSIKGHLQINISAVPSKKVIKIVIAKVITLSPKY